MPYTTIDSPKKYFEAKTYTGTGATQSITGLSFKPDMTWLKIRNQAYDHAVQDAVRGATKDLETSSTDAEQTRSMLTAFTSDGFTLGTDSQSNSNGNTFVSWNWLGANTTVSNTSGSITSTVSANTTSGFSIVSYTGTGANATVGHGLGVAPKFIIFKNRSSATGWACYNVNIGASKYLALNETIEAQTATGVSNSTDPTSSVFSIGTADRVNTNGNTYIAYCFAEVKGFSKAFSYTGNGSADGTYVHLGFRPAWVMVKASSTGGAGYNWQVWDNKRNTYNAVNTQLRPNTSEVDNTDSSYAVDFLSNGFKMRGTSSNQNGSGVTYIGFAIAEQPFVSSKGIVANAR